MTAKIYKYGSNIHGFYVQRETCSQTLEGVTKKHLMAMSDLRHPVCTKEEYYQTLSTDMRGAPEQEFELLGLNALIVVTR